MQTNYQSGEACCFTGREAGVDPTQEKNVVMAGEVCTSTSCGCGVNVDGAESGGCKLAQVYFPDQAYRAGFCPCQAMEKGTLFPELVSPFTPATQCLNKD